MNGCRQTILNDAVLEINTPHMQGTAWTWKQRDTFLVVTKLRSDDCKEKLPFVGQNLRQTLAPGHPGRSLRSLNLTAARRGAPSILQRLEMRLKNGSAGEERDKKRSPFCMDSNTPAPS